tara:strand:+ start:910 stop:1173 length:264 start_codon:yes stop_codon:yes gene_type:complete
MNKLRAARANLIFAFILLIPFQVLAEGDLEPNEEIFASVCRGYDQYGSFTKCEDDHYNFEIPLIYEHELPLARNINLSTDSVDLVFR